LPSRNVERDCNPVLTDVYLCVSCFRKTKFVKAAIADITKKLQHQAPIGKGDGSISGKFKDLTGAGKIVHICIPVPFADFDYYYTDGILQWLPNPGQKLGPVTVPHGFCTDLTCIPQPVWSLLPKTGRYAYATIAHDYLYWTQTTSREEADDVLLAAMEDSEVGSKTKWTIYGSVSAAGNSAWNANAAAKANGDKRFLKAFPPKTKLTSWADWKADKSHFKD
jgi:hypothetical protein